MQRVVGVGGRPGVAEEGREPQHRLRVAGLQLSILHELAELVR
jgi:hypothetical protein